MLDVQNLVVVRLVYVASSHGVGDVSLELAFILYQDVRSLLVQRIVRIRLEEQKVESYQDRVQVQHWRPIFT